jgi:hypothetical protein
LPSELLTESLSGNLRRKSNISSCLTWHRRLWILSSESRISQHSRCHSMQTRSTVLPGSPSILCKGNRMSLSVKTLVSGSSARRSLTIRLEWRALPRGKAGRIVVPALLRTNYLVRTDCHCDSWKLALKLYGRMSGMSLEIQPLGIQSIVLNGTEKYSWWVSTLLIYLLEAVR